MRHRRYGDERGKHERECGEEAVSVHGVDDVEDAFCTGVSPVAETEYVETIPGTSACMVTNSPFGRKANGNAR